MTLTIQNTLEQPNIRSVFKQENASIGFSVVKTLVIRFMDSFGFATKTTDSQIEIITVDTLENFAYDSLEDIILFFKMCRQGKFGSTKKGVDSNLIFGEWLPMYFDLKAEARENTHQKSKQESNKNVLSDEDIRKAYRIANPQKKHEEEKAYIDGLTKDFSRDDLEDLITQWNIKKQNLHLLDALKRKRKDIK